ncbi:endonuclease domain-containing protein [Undibacterium danionis]|uniref:Endonuclease domain-containing protein n=1 Tax=Undibacterium danionis TaxID=1812100 RepID=A0ABV6IE40_9BURK
MRNFSNPQIAENARGLRKTMTDVERLLWLRLRGEQLGVKLRWQHPFLNYILDFVCLELKLVVELDGSQHMNAQTYDEYRTKCLNDADYVVLRFWNNQVIEELGSVVEEIYRQLQLRKKEFERP